MSSLPRRFQYHRGTFKPPGSGIVIPPSKFSNPFRPARGEYGDPAAHARVVAQYREWITAPAQAGLLAAARRELRGLDLGCSCRPGLPCHADVLLELVNQE
jgi:hypothetical protein